eukprot:230699-Prorocentrum_minimum.AAC.1
MSALPASDWSVVQISSRFLSTQACAAAGGARVAGLVGAEEDPMGGGLWGWSVAAAPAEGEDLAAHVTCRRYATPACVPAEARPRLTVEEARARSERMLRHENRAEVRPTRRTNRTREARAYSLDGPIGRGRRGHILSTDQSDAGNPAIRLDAAVVELTVETLLSRLVAREFVKRGELLG